MQKLDYKLRSGKLPGTSENHPRNVGSNRLKNPIEVPLKKKNLKQ